MPDCLFNKAAGRGNCTSTLSNLAAENPNLLTQSLGRNCFSPQVLLFHSILCADTTPLLRAFASALWSHTSFRSAVAAMEEPAAWVSWWSRAQVPGCRQGCPPLLCVPGSVPPPSSDSPEMDRVNKIFYGSLFLLPQGMSKQLSIEAFQMTFRA